MIDVVNTVNSPVIEIRVDKIWDDGTRHRTRPAARPARRHDLRLRHQVHVPADLVQIRNTCAVRARSQPYIRLADYIENPIGKTQVENERRHPVRPEARDHPHQHARTERAARRHRPPEPDPRQPRHRSATRSRSRWSVPAHPDRSSADGNEPAPYYDIVVQVDAGKDAVLDLTANRRTDEALGSRSPGSPSTTSTPATTSTSCSTTARTATTSPPRSSRQPVRPGGQALPLRLPDRVHPGAADTGPHHRRARWTR